MRVGLKGGVGAVAFVAIATAGVSAYLYRTEIMGSIKPDLLPRSRTQIIVKELEGPLVMRTRAGRLEVATLRMTETVERSADWSWRGMSFGGKTVSAIEVPVVYQYLIDLGEEWPIEINGKQAIVRPPGFRAHTPVGIDTTGVKKRTESGWARFDKDENLVALEKSLGPELELRARAPRNISRVRDEARKTVEEFVAAWLLKEHQWSREAGRSIVVLFPGEPMPSERMRIEAQQ